MAKRTTIDTRIAGIIGTGGIIEVMEVDGVTSIVAGIIDLGAHRTPEEMIGNLLKR